MTPAESIRLAVSMLDDAVLAIRELGVDWEPLQEFDSIVERLREEAESLPHRILAAEDRQCDICPHGKESIEIRPYGERQVQVRGIECLTETPTDCPRVKACGFTSDELPAFLRRQAE